MISYQFFLRTTDADVENYLNLFTLLDPQEVKSMMVSHNVKFLVISARDTQFTIVS